MAWFGITVVALLLAKLAAQCRLEWLNRKNVQANSTAVPEAFQQVITPEVYRKSVAYTLARNGFHIAELAWDFVLLILALFSGALPAAHQVIVTRFGDSALTNAGFLVGIAILLSVLSWPFDAYSQFRLEQQHGFNTTTPQTWWLDRAKGILLGIILGWPLLWLVLKIVEWTGGSWWLWAWGAIVGFQLVMALLAPILILPLFNKFTPLPEGSLKERLLNLAQRTAFRTRSIQVMDGSRRSRHSNAFFTGFGKFRKVVLFDTLIQQLSDGQLEAVLAHEIGHFKKRHIPKMLVLSSLSALVGLFVLSWLAKQPWFFVPFGWPPGATAPALLLFMLLAGTVSFWFAPLGNWWSRRCEYEADAYASRVMGEPEDLVQALRKLNEKNLSNLTPHPLYSGFYYSHPTLLEREAALRNHPPATSVLSNLA